MHCLISEDGRFILNKSDVDPHRNDGATYVRTCMLKKVLIDRWLFVFIYGTDRMQRREDTRVRVNLLASASDLARECK